MKKAVLIFAKNLIYGQVKTRLAVTLGNDAAIKIYKDLLQHTNTILQSIEANKIVFYSSYIDEKDVWDNKLFQKQIQDGHDLGNRMENAFAYAFEKEYEQVIIIGTDCFELSSTIIAEAFTQLKDHDLVVGPAMDGGYYLLGMNSLHPSLFRILAWSTSTVFDETIAISKSLGLSYYLLPTLNDIDEEKDFIGLKPIQHDQHHHPNI